MRMVIIIKAKKVGGIKNNTNPRIASPIHGVMYVLLVGRGVGDAKDNYTFCRDRGVDRASGKRMSCPKSKERKWID